MSALTLVIGTRKLSSWSFRPWMVLKQLGIPFEEVEIILESPQAKELLRVHSPSGRVPVLKDGNLSVWDSLAICEYLAEKHPDAKLWPTHRSARAMARSVSAEMHSGFLSVRQQMPMDCGLRTTKALSPEVRADVDRIVLLWAECRRGFGQGGPYLFGTFSIADAMFAPVVSRFISYGVPLPEEAKRYVDTMAADPSFRAWMELAERAQGEAA
jgi:glutathione S-transferase